MKVRPLTEILQESPAYTERQGWRFDSDALRLVNPKFGSVEQVVICADNGNPLWDQYQIVENVGAVIVPYTLQDVGWRIGLITTERPVVFGVSGVQGIKSIELPRGFPVPGETSKQAAQRELSEETGRQAVVLEALGLINPNTAFYTTSIPAYAAQVDLGRKEEVKTQGYEKILKSEFKDVAEVVSMLQRGDITCGFTQAALMLFFAGKVLPGAKRF
jgi:8-oxo-dGTP pyrophosphatase MutT (NUDIX family)